MTFSVVPSLEIIGLSELNLNEERGVEKQKWRME